MHAAFQRNITVAVLGCTCISAVFAQRGVIAHTAARAACSAYRAENAMTPAAPLRLTTTPRPEVPDGVVISTLRS
jgi:hypothetical protein